MSTVPIGGYEPWVDPDAPANNNGTGDAHVSALRPKPRPPKGKRAGTTKRQSAGRFQAANDFYNGLDTCNLSRSALAAWLILWQRTDAETGLVRMSHQTLARKIRMQERQGKRIVQELVDAGYLEIVHRAGTERWKCNTYRVCPTPVQGKKP
jgi:hypothetical protein